MNYGFLIDNRKCIGCHACSTACKMENEVPLGVNRTWVKSVEVGAYPDVRRHFQVTRCNHCANPPCVRICPVTAMYQRTDGIVEFDASICIGCKACMQACPYDAIYIDPDSHTAAKCHYCAHRTDIGLEPACVVVCPEHAILAGDMDDPSTEISRLLASEKVTVRKPEQGTVPKLFYINGNEIALHPTAVERTPVTFAFADVIPLHAAPAKGDGGHTSARSSSGNPPRAASGVAIRTPSEQGIGWGGPIHIGQGRMAEQMAQVAWNAQHEIPWHWPVPTYLVTKAIGAGLFTLLCLYVLWRPLEAGFLAGMGAVALFFTALTAGLLVYDLERPERFFLILTRPQWKSWLTRGAFLLLGFSLVAGLWWVVQTGAALGWWGGAVVTAMQWIASTAGVVLALAVACYTAFLFGQAEGRDLWQSPLLPFHLIVQALMAGSATLLLMAPLVTLFTTIDPTLLIVARWTLALALFVDLFLILAGEFAMPHASEVAAR
ncbi:MAG: 4Fe-4S dicluster domain-containing protein, partial [Caldilineaceae bacterium]